MSIVQWRRPERRDVVGRVRRGCGVGVGVKGGRKRRMESVRWWVGGGGEELAVALVPRFSVGRGKEVSGVSGGGG